MGNQRGIALSYVVIFIFVLFATAGLAVNLGNLAWTATEVQNAADAGAVAGARALLEKVADPSTHATAVLSGNQVHGATPIMESFELGTYTTAIGFVVGGPPQDAVKVTVSATATNIIWLDGIFGSATSPVTKNAVAAILNLGEDTPTLPLSLCNGAFDPNCTGAGCLPVNLTLSSDKADNAGWTSFLPNTSPKDFLPDSGAHCRGGTEAAPIAVGDAVYVTNGVAADMLKCVATMFDSNPTQQYVVPVVDLACGNLADPKFVGSPIVLGFATITVTSVVTTGNDKSITVDVVPGRGSGAPGGGTFGTRTVRLVG